MSPRARATSHTGPNDEGRRARSGSRRLPLVLLIGGVLVAGSAIVLRLNRSAGPSGAPAGSPPPTVSGDVSPAPAPSPVEASAAPPVMDQLLPRRPWPADLPPLPRMEYLPPRPFDLVEAVYEFAARRPDVLKYVPCFCGCERNGHVGNDDCFVASRDPKGRVTTWDMHGYG